MLKKRKNLLVVLLSITGVLLIVGIFSYSYLQDKEERKKASQGEITREQKEGTKDMGDENLHEEQEKYKKDESKIKELEEKTTDWHSYENKQYKYKFKYPQNWYAGPENKEDAWIVYFTNKKVDKINEIDLLEGVKVEILVQGNPRGLSLQEWVNEGHVFSGKPKSLKEIYVAGLKAYQEEVDFEGMTTNVYFFYNDDVYTLSYSGIEGDYNKYKSDFDLMIESFEIIN